MIMKQDLLSFKDLINDINLVHRVELEKTVHNVVSIGAKNLAICNAYDNVLTNYNKPEPYLSVPISSGTWTISSYSVDKEQPYLIVFEKVGAGDLLTDLYEFSSCPFELGVVQDYHLRPVKEGCNEYFTNNYSIICDMLVDNGRKGKLGSLFNDFFFTYPKLRRSRVRVTKDQYDNVTRIVIL